MHVLNVERFCIRYIIDKRYSYIIIYKMSFSPSNNLTVTVWKNKQIVYVLSTRSQLADNVQVKRMKGNNSATVIIIVVLQPS